MVIIRKHLSQPWFDFIKNGVKIIEGRLDRGDFAVLMPEDKILFYNCDDKNQEILTLVTKISRYETFSQLLEQEGVKNVIPGSDLEDAVRIYRMYYDKQDELTYGVVAIHLKVIERIYEYIL